MIDVTYNCGGCFETATVHVRAEVTQVTPNMARVRRFTLVTAAPEGWVVYDPYTFCTYCPECWALIQEAGNALPPKEHVCDMDNMAGECSVCGEYP